jgi:hypothetical protein
MRQTHLRKIRLPARSRPLSPTGLNQSREKPRGNVVKFPLYVTIIRAEFTQRADVAILNLAILVLAVRAAFIAAFQGCNTARADMSVQIEHI